MKKNKWITVWLSITLSLGIFSVIGIIFLPLFLNQNSSVVAEEESFIPYYSAPQNSGILYLSDDGSGALIFLNFEAKTTSVNIFLENAEEKALLVGYEINYTIKGNNEFLCELCNRLGGIELVESGTLYRFTAAGLAEKLEESDTISEKANISEGFFKKVAKLGLSWEDFQFIIESTKTNLNFPVCYSWGSVLKGTVANYIFENVF